MRLTYDRLNLEDLRGRDQVDYLVSLDAHLILSSEDGETRYEEPGFPVVELARALLIWLGDPTHPDFDFDSMSYEEVGSIFVHRQGTGWSLGSTFAPGQELGPVSWAAVEGCCRAFVEVVKDDLTAHELNAAAILRA